MRTIRKVSLVLAAGFLVMAALITGPAKPTAAREDNGRQHQIIVPKEDRFTPFAMTIRAGDSVLWINQDTDDHTVVSDDFFNTAGNRNTNRLLVGTDNNKGQPGAVQLRFDHAGTFVYYCRFHSQLDAAHQPIAPGPDGGIQGPGANFGTPMMGVITVVGDRD